MTQYVPPTEQLVTEILVRDIRRSTAFYRQLGFELLRDGGDFVEMTWKNQRLWLPDKNRDTAERSVCDHFETRPCSRRTLALCPV